MNRAARARLLEMLARLLPAGRAIGAAWHCPAVSAARQAMVAAARDAVEGSPPGWRCWTRHPPAAAWTVVELRR